MKSMRFIIPLLAAAGLTGCGGSGIGLGGVPQTNQCQTGTQVQVVSPTPGQVDSNVNQVTIVASGDTDNIHPDPQNWSIYVVGNLGGAQISGGQLNPISDTGAPHPFTQDFYYQSQLSQTLPAGVNWTVYLQETGNACQAVQLQSFST